MKTFVVAVVALLAASAWAADPPNVEVKEVNNKCVWTMRTPVPDAKAGGCPATFPNKGKLETFAQLSKDMTAGMTKMVEDTKLASSPLANRVTQAMIERMEIDQDVIEVTAAIQEVDSSNKLLAQRAAKLASEIGALNSKATSLQAAVNKLMA
ncbi:uncharacterized protein LOC144863498 [Branchiostoma floridae x Branchiostoma japonicum]